MKTIVVSAVNLRVGGTLTILRDCLQYLSILAECESYRIVALVYDKNLVYYPNIEYIEMEWPKKTWIGRLWCEYVTMKNISKDLAPVYLWLSLHDTTPNVVAERRAVYCHNSFPFYTWKAREWLFTPKIVMFTLFSKWIYRINIYKNDQIVVQQQWFKDAFINWFKLKEDSIIVAPPKNNDFKGALPLSRTIVAKSELQKSSFVFFYAGTANSHKNFECLCAAAQILRAKIGDSSFEVHITVKGDENGYGRWLYRKWGKCPCLKFIGFLSREKLYNLYERADCLVFPSKVETWGLPITEFASFQKPMLLADLPYAHETASGYDHVSFFSPDNPTQLAEKMEKLVFGNYSGLRRTEKVILSSPVAESWHELFTLLLK